MRRAARLAVALLTAITLAAGTPAVASSPQWTPLSYTPAPADNPLKGFMPYAGSYQTFPYSMEWFYLPLRDVMTGPRQFRWAALERQLNDIASRCHQAVFRSYLDYPQGAAGGEQNHFTLGLGGTTKLFADFTLDGGGRPVVTTSYQDIRIPMAANGINRNSPSQLTMGFWHGGTSTITIDHIAFQ